MTVTVEILSDSENEIQPLLTGDSEDLDPEFQITIEKAQRVASATSFMIASSVLLSLSVAAVITAFYIRKQCIETIPNYQNDACYTTDRFVFSGVLGALGLIFMGSGCVLVRTAKKL